MSEHVAHFTKEWAGASAFRNLMQILYRGKLSPGPSGFGSARNLAWLGDIRRAVCFSETPIPYLGRIAERRSQYGLGFTQKFVAERLGARVWYLDVGSAHEQVWMQIQAEREARMDPNDPFWGLATCVDRAGQHGHRRYEFEWEREWRVVGQHGLEFHVEDVAFLFLPESEHLAADGFFRDFFDRLERPSYQCPFIDPLWPPARIEEALAMREEV